MAAIRARSLALAPTGDSRIEGQLVHHLKKLTAWHHITTLPDVAGLDVFPIVTVTIDANAGAPDVFTLDVPKLKACRYLRRVASSATMRPFRMEPLERTAVQLWEARRLAAHDDVPHGRLALLLLDNAAETMLMRSANEALGWGDFHGRLLRQLRDAPVEDEDAQALKRKLAEKTVSKKARRQIERNFIDLVDYVFNRRGLHARTRVRQLLQNPASLPQHRLPPGHGSSRGPRSCGAQI